jgi:phosphoribosylamine--glycine ligase
MMRLKSDLLDLMIASADGTLDQSQADWHDDVALTVVMAAKGYPGAYEKGTEIKGLNAISADEAEIFHAGTKFDGDKILANGGRVLNVTALGTSVKGAQEAAYKAVSKIDWPEGFCRSDIGWRAVVREN